MKLPKVVNVQNAKIIVVCCYNHLIFSLFALFYSCHVNDFISELKQANYHVFWLLTQIIHYNILSEGNHKKNV